ncbi:glycosyltransferase family 9 protein, partial [Buttiauxella noackiae]|uniref:glycosyltransferase family 9 protein n=1 Tax=Buttiauxella noackiae TaxID=82992 RepID=UPI000B21ED41
PASLHFLRKIKPKNIIGFNKENYNIYNKNIPFDGYHKHISARYSLLMENMKFKGYSIDYDLYIPDNINTQVLNYLEELPGKYNIIINPFTASDKRDLSDSQLQDLVNKLHKKYNQVNILVIGLPERIKNISLQGIFIHPNMSIYSAMSLIYHANLIISPDTSIVHIAAAWKKPLVALYGNDKHGMFNNNDVWGPGYPEAIQVTTQDKYHAISTISTIEILQAVDTVFFKED